MTPNNINFLFFYCMAACVCVCVHRNTDPKQALQLAFPPSFCG